MTTSQPIGSFVPARRVNQSLTAGAEKRVLEWMARRAPMWVTSDRLTALGFAAQCGAGVCYAVSGSRPYALLLVIACLALNWLGDSLDGTLARVRNCQRPRYGFYVDHVVDIFGATALLCGLGFSGYIHWQIALAMLVAFLLLAGESYLATYTLSRFQLSQGLFGPTELRLLLIAGNLTLLRNPYVGVFGQRVLLFDLGGAIGAAGMAVAVVALAVRHTAQLYREEPLP
jgi:phosphatidylglycerophosphate synthase